MKIGGPMHKEEPVREEPELQEEFFVEEPPIEEPVPEPEPPLTLEPDTIEDIQKLLEKMQTYEQEKVDLIKKHQDEMTAVKTAIKNALYGEKTPIYVDKLPTKE